MRKSFRVSLTIPEFVAEEEMRIYILESIQTCIGGMDPELPITELNRETIIVIPIKGGQKP